MKSVGQGKGAFVERREEVNLDSSVFKEWQSELAEIDKHEIVVKISDILGTCPSNIGPAERIFEQLKFEIAKYVVHHEYSKESHIKSKLLLWLDSKSNPDKLKKLSRFCSKYLK